MSSTKRLVLGLALGLLAGPGQGDEIAPGILRTPEGRFAGLAEYPFPLSRPIWSASANRTRRRRNPLTATRCTSTS